MKKELRMEYAPVDKVDSKHRLKMRQLKKSTNEVSDKYMRQSLLETENQEMENAKGKKCVKGWKN